MAEPQRVAIAPGPAGTSCLTCKRRHKKCDLRRPVCERCEKGGFECLGYSHIRSPLLPLESSRLHCTLPNQEITKSLPASPGSTRMEVEGLNRGAEATLSSWGNQNDRTSDSSSLCLGDRFIDAAQHLDHVDIRPKSRTLMARNHQPPLAAHSPVKCALDPTPSLRSLSRFYTQIPHVPHHLSKTLLDSSNLEDYIMSHFDLMMERTYFKPMRGQLALTRSSFTLKLRASGFGRWIVFLNARVCESYFKGDTSQNATYDCWLRQMEQVLRDALTRDLTPREMQDRLGNWLQVDLLKARIFQGSNTYCLLRNATPTFLQILFSEPTLWPSKCDLTSVPLANVIASQRHELSFFVLLDITAAMAFGLPQQVEYDTSPGYPSKGPTPHERMHCVPPEFQILLAEINACRDKSLSVRDWKEIEYQLITWQACPSEYDANLESCMIVAWLAVQESWRHTLLVYLYMAVCGASSDDPRIQSSIRQIFSVIGTVKKQEASDANVPFFIQSLMAGICARSERHRSLARRQLTHTSDLTLHLMRAVDFVPVLDYLWHGAAADGRPIKWGDYVRSREAVIPVLI